MGMVRTFQLTKVMGLLTVLDNMRLGATEQTGEKLFKALFTNIWGSGKRRSTRRPRILLVRSSSSTPRRTTTRPACPAASASCWRWPGP